MKKKLLHKNFGRLCSITTCLFFLFFATQYATAQQQVIKGKVVDSEGIGLPSVTVLVKGTSTGSISDLDGNFQITVQGEGKVLQFKFVGMKTVDLPVQKNQGSIKVVMEDDATNLDDVVVIGYGTTTRRDLTGAVSSISGKDIANVPVLNVESAIAGRLAGVQVTQSDGSVDAEVKIRVRGGGSITQDNSPLYILDGVPIDNIRDIPSQDILSIDVLKDASSTAIYGARGANGVIIITTKDAQAGKTVVNYNGYYQYKQISNFLDVMDPYEYVLWQYEFNSLQGGEYFTQFTRNFGEYDDVDIYKNVNGVDRQLQLFGSPVISNTHNISISGGVKTTRFNLSYTNNDDPGHVYGSGTKRNNLNFKFNHNIADNIRADISVRYSHTNVNGAGTSSSRSAVSYRPVKGKSDADEGFINPEEELLDEIATKSSLYDPLTLAKQDYKNQVRKSLDVNASLLWDISKNLSFRTEYGIRENGSKSLRFYGPLTGTARSAGGLPVAIISTNESPRWRNLNTLIYKLKFKKDHTVDLLGGYEVSSEAYSSIESTSRNFPKDVTKDIAFAMMNLGSQEYTDTREGGDVRMQSLFGRFNYGYKGRYLFTASLRADGSSKFAPENRWGYFPSGAIAWRLSDEPFMAGINNLSNLKFRLSYGEAGNNRLDNDLWRRTYNTGAVSAPIIGINDVPNVYYKVSSGILTNPNLKWETTVTRNAGIDFGIFKQRLSGTIELYWNTTRDLLIKSPIPTITGYKEQMKNIGQTSNRGIEVTLNGTIIQTKDFNFAVALNFSKNNNQVDKLDGITSKFFRSGWSGTTLKETDDYILQVGQSIGLIYGYVTDGFYTMDDFIRNPLGGYWLKDGIANSQTVTRNFGGTLDSGPALGGLKLKKLTPVDPNDPNTYDITPADRTVIGNATPKHSGGINFTSSYKNLDCSLFFNWVYGNSIYNASKIYFTTTQSYQYYNMLSIVDSENRFRYYNDMGVRVWEPEDLTELNKDATMWVPSMQSTVLHSWAIEDGSFLRLSNVTLGYTLPKKLTKKVGISNCRFYGSVNNLFTWTKYTGYDPEVDMIRSTPLTPGVDWNSFPKSRTFTMGVNLTF